jgi:hypothetical protein
LSESSRFRVVNVPIARFSPALNARVVSNDSNAGRGSAATRGSGLSVETRHRPPMRVNANAGKVHIISALQLDRIVGV